MLTNTLSESWLTESYFSIRTLLALSVLLVARLKLTSTLRIRRVCRVEITQQGSFLSGRTRYRFQYSCVALYRGAGTGDLICMELCNSKPRFREEEIANQPDTGEDKRFQRPLGVRAGEHDGAEGYPETAKQNEQFDVFVAEVSIFVGDECVQLVGGEFGERALRDVYLIAREARCGCL